MLDRKTNEWTKYRVCSFFFFFFFFFQIQTRSVIGHLFDMHLCKVMEHPIIASSIPKHLTQYDVLHELQRGFIEVKCSCETQRGPQQIGPN